MSSLLFYLLYLGKTIVWFTIEGRRDRARAGQERSIPVRSVNGKGVKDVRTISDTIMDARWGTSREPGEPARENSGLRRISQPGVHITGNISWSDHPDNPIGRSTIPSALPPSGSIHPPSIPLFASTRNSDHTELLLAFTRVPLFPYFPFSSSRPFRSILRGIKKTGRQTLFCCTIFLPPRTRF